MNQKIIYLMIFFIIFQDTTCSNDITTIMAPEIGNPFIVMVDESGINSHINIGNTIYLGDGSNAIYISANNSNTFPIVWPSNNQINLLAINANGQLVTINGDSSQGNFINLTVSQSSSIGTYTLGIGANLTIPYNGINPITLISSDGIKFTATNSDIQVISSSIIPPSNANGAYLLAIDSDNNIITINAFNEYTFGNNSMNYIKIDNSNNNQGVNIVSSKNEVQDITVNANNGNIIFFSNTIAAPNTGLISYLGINEYNQIVSFEGKSGVPGVFSSLSASEEVTLGTYVAAEGANITIPNDLISPISLYSSSGVELFANNSNITIASDSITPPNDLQPFVILAIDNNANIVTTNNNNIYSLGIPNNNNNFLRVDNIGNTGVTLNGNVFIQNAGFSLPGINQTAVLTVDYNGKIGILLSSEKFKEDITSLKINPNDFDQLTPCQYSYKGKNKKEFGLIAEEVYKNESLKEALVVLDDANEPLTINYQAVLIALLEQFLAYKKEIKNELKQRDERIEKLENFINAVLLRG